MKPDEVIALAREAELICDKSVTTAWVEWHDLTPELVKFAALIEAKVKADLLAGAGGPVAEVYRHGKDSAGREWHGIHWYDPNVDTPSGTKIYTADQTAAAVLRERENRKPLTEEQIEIAWRHGWASCRDAEYVGKEAEDERWGLVCAEVAQAIRARGNKT